MYIFYIETTQLHATKHNSLASDSEHMHYQQTLP
jgi:hypothetical protein